MNFYNEIASGYDELHREEQFRKLSLIKEHLAVTKKSKLLDVGCGTGFSLEFFNCDWTGIDPSQEVLEYCKGNNVLGVGEELPFSDNEFDLVICISALHHFDDPLQGLKEMKRVCKDALAITVFKKGKNQEKVEMLRKLISENFEIKKEIDDLHDYIFICE